MDKLKAQIIETANSELAKARNIKIQEELKAKQRARDAAIAAKTSTTAGSPTKVGDDPEATGWGRGGPAKKADAPDSPAPKRDDDSFITRSSNKREFKPEENKERDSGGLRRNKPPAQDEPAGFSRGNFKSKREEEAPKRDGPPRFNRGGDKREGGDKKDDTAGFGGFRSNARGKGKK